MPYSPEGDTGNMKKLSAVQEIRQDINGDQRKISKGLRSSTANKHNFLLTIGVLWKIKQQ
jgi:hypothetical protein